METELHSHLQTLAARYQEAQGLTRTRVAILAFKDANFFKRLESDPDATFTVKKYDAAVAWFSENWPAGAEWPANVQRPERAAA